MLGRKSVLISLTVIVLIGISAAASFSSGSADGDDIIRSQFDLALALEEASGGDEIKLNGDAVLLRSATIKPGVTLDDCGFSLTIPAEAALGVEGVFVSSGNLKVDNRGSIAVAKNGLVSVDNNGNVAEITGSLEIYSEGVFNLGLNENSALEILGTGRLLVEGTMVVGYDILNSTVNIRNGTVTGELLISDGSIFRVFDVLVIGNPPLLVTELDSSAKVSGKINLDSTAYVLVYGKSDFSSTNIRYPSVNTVFTIAGSGTYATEYKDTSGKRTLVMPSTSDLKDWVLDKWMADNSVVTDGSGIQIGSTGYKTITGTATKKLYNVDFAEDKSIIWRINGIDRGSSWTVRDAAYGAPYSVSVRPAPGHTGQPAIYVDGVQFPAGTLVSVAITKETAFTTSNHHLESDSSNVPTLLIILGVMIAIFALVFTAYIVKNKKAK